MAQAQAPLIPFHPNMKHTDRERFICIYPAYIDAKKTVQEGRKMPKDICLENPTYQEIKDVLASANINLVVENKIYPRERSKELLHRGRVRVQLKNEDGSAINPDLKTRRQVLKYVCEMIPQLKSRIANPQGGEAPVQSTSQQTGATKKGKGKKR